MRLLSLFTLLLCLATALARRSFAPAPVKRTPPVKLTAPTFAGLGGLAAGWPAGTPAPTVEVGAGPATPAPVDHVEEGDYHHHEHEEDGHHHHDHDAVDAADLLDEETLAALAAEWHARGVDGDPTSFHRVAPPPPGWEGADGVWEGVPRVSARVAGDEF